MEHKGAGNAAHICKKGRLDSRSTLAMLRTPCKRWAVALKGRVQLGWTGTSGGHSRGLKRGRAQRSRHTWCAGPSTMFRKWVGSVR